MIVEKSKNGESLKSHEDIQRLVGNKIVQALDGFGVLRLIFDDDSFIESSTWNIPFRYEYFQKAG